MMIASFEVDSKAIIALSKKAGEAIMEIYESSKDVVYSKKDDDSPLTQADINAHEVISHGLEELNPNIPMVSEEGRRGDPEESVHSWLVDPLDGTKEFIKRNGMFTVNIALMKKNGSRWKPVFGIVHAPATNTTWIGGSDVPATLFSNGVSKKISVSDSSTSPVRIVASGSHRGEKDELFAESLGEHELVRMGSSLKACAVADGTADIYPRFGPTSCWDIAAAHAVVSAAGGSIIGPDGNELDYDLVDEILNPFFMVTSRDDWIEPWIRCQGEIPGGR